MKIKLFVLIILALVGAAIYFYIDKARKTNEVEDYDISPLTPTASSAGSSTGSSVQTPVIENHDPKVIVKRGSRGINVEYVQKALNRVLRDKGETQLVTDGVFGSKTENAVYKLTGKKMISYAVMKAFVIKYFTNQGKPNPYPTGSTESASASSTTWTDVYLNIVTAGLY